MISASSLHSRRSMLRMPTTRSLAMNNIPKRVVCRLWPTECVAEGTAPIDNCFMPAAPALNIFPAACPAGWFCDFNRFIVMAESAAPAVGYWLAVCRYIKVLAQFLQLNNLFDLLHSVAV